MTCSVCGGVAQLGERLLCKQEVVGSIPSASMVCLACWSVLSQKGLGFGVHGRVATVGWVVSRAVRWRVFFTDCESGSGASLDAQGVSVGLGDAVFCGRRGGLDWREGSVTVWHGLSDLGVGCCVSGIWPQVPSLCSVQGCL